MVENSPGQSTRLSIAVESRDHPNVVLLGPQLKCARSTMGTCAGLRDQTTVLSVLPGKCLP